MAAVPINDLAIMIILIIIHIVAIVYSWKVGKVFNSRSWMLIVSGFIILFFRRIVVLLDLFEVVSGNTAALIDNIYLPLLAWTLIGLGLIKIHYSVSTSIYSEKKKKRK